MAKKVKETVWHKKRGKFISPSSLKPQYHHEEDAEVSPKKKREKKFAKSLADKIKKAVQ